MNSGDVIYISDEDGKSPTKLSFPRAHRQSSTTEVGCMNVVSESTSLEQGQRPELDVYVNNTVPSHTTANEATLLVQCSSEHVSNIQELCSKATTSSCVSGSSVNHLTATASSSRETTNQTTDSCSCCYHTSSAMCLKKYFGNRHCTAVPDKRTEHVRHQSLAEEKSKNSVPFYSSEYIFNLEKQFKTLQRKVQQLRETEMSLDDMNDCQGAYAMEDKYTKKMLHLWRRLCKINGRSDVLRSVKRKKYTYSGSPFTEINDRVMEFVNKFNIVPSYSDILRIVRECQRKGVICLEPHHVEAVARDVFTEVGIDLQDKRHLEFIKNFGCHLTDSIRVADDPALYDVELQKRLEQNRQVAVSRLADVIDKYARQQVLETGTSDVTDDSDAEVYIVDNDNNILGSEHSHTPDNASNHSDNAACSEHSRVPRDTSNHDDNTVSSVDSLAPRDMSDCDDAERTAKL